MKVKREPLPSDVQEENVSDQQSSEEHKLLGSESGGSSNNSRQSRPPQRETRREDPYPPGFSALLNRINKLSGDKGAGDFEAWLDDYVEATNVCNWDAKNRAKWFSWFLTGPAKASWQHTLKPAEKLQWERIKKCLRGNMVST